MFLAEKSLFLDNKTSWKVILNMKKVKDIFCNLKDRIANRKERVHRMIELKRLKRTRSKYIPPYVHCQNCGTKLEGMYCHNCGQYAHDNSQPFWKYVWQYFENVYQFDYKIPVTIWQLFRRPGFLTNEFNAGKIVSYMHPMKLNMFILVVFFTIVVFMGEKVVDDQFTQANIPGYIHENLKLDSQYFSGKDTTIFFIGNPYMLEDYPDIFTIKKRLSGKHSVKKLSKGEKVQIPELPEMAEAGGESSLVRGVMKMGEDMRMDAFYTYEDEQTGNDTILLSLPVVFLRDRIVVKGDLTVPSYMFDKAGVDKKNFNGGADYASISAIAETLDMAAVSNSLDSAEIAEIRRELESATLEYFYKVTPEKRYAKIDGDNAVKRTYFDEFLSLAKSWLPLVILLTIPFMAFLLKAIYRKKKMNYMSHFVFSLHFCAALFITLFVVLLLLSYASFIPSTEMIKCYVTFLFIYFIIASHTVYSGTGWVKSILKSLFVLFLYLLGVTILLSLLMLIFLVKAAGV